MTAKYKAQINTRGNQKRSTKKHNQTIETERSTMNLRNDYLPAILSTRHSVAENSTRQFRPSSDSLEIMSTVEQMEQKRKTKDTMMSKVYNNRLQILINNGNPKVYENTDIKNEVSTRKRRDASQDKEEENSAYTFRQMLQQKQELFE